MRGLTHTGRSQTTGGPRIRSLGYWHATYTPTAGVPQRSLPSSEGGSKSGSSRGESVTATAYSRSCGLRGGTYKQHRHGKSTQSTARKQLSLVLIAVAGVGPPRQQVFRAVNNGSASGPLVIRQQSQTEKLENLYTAYLEPGVISAPIKRQGVTVQPVLMTMLDYAKIGFVHIVPKGLDHILFVLGLFFYAARWRPLLGQVTLFTLAHTTTLMLASTGHIVVSPNLVEPLIAASIIYVAFENLRSERLHAGRLLVIFAFGLLHGLGFASVLGDIGLADGQFMVSLISFNIGVELGQLAVLVPAFLLFGVVAGNALWYRRLIAIPSSCLIGAIGMWMLITRVFAN